MSETPHHVHACIEQENIQTANDTNLFDNDNKMEDESQTRFQFDTPKCVVLQEDSIIDLDVASQPPTRATLSDRGGKCCMTSITSKKLATQRNYVKLSSGKTKNEHKQNMKEMKWQWDTTLRERQEQLAMAQEEIELAQEQEQQEAELCETLAQCEEVLKRKTNKDMRQII
ncbi:hypothetical protein BDR05DRAFT_948538 [Suillus weaverae]|nr:hypothetical protein BDR05DRAFT_948538 [Suillus weaverae]